MKPLLVKFQIGKNGLTDGVINSLELALKNHKQIKISVLKSATRDREELKKMSFEIAQKLSSKCDIKLIGYTIVIIKKGKNFKKR